MIAFLISLAGVICYTVAYNLTGSHDYLVIDYTFAAILIACYIDLYLFLNIPDEDEEEGQFYDEAVIHVTQPHDSTKVTSETFDKIKDKVDNDTV